MVRKRDDDPCRKAKLDCSVIGGYSYHWLSRKLYRAGDGEYVPLSGRERDALEHVLYERVPGERGDLTISDTLRARPEVSALLTRLGLQP